jgi:uncharacterized membrane protein
MLKFLLKVELPLLVVAGILAQKIAAKLWSSALGGPVPDTAQRDVQVAQLIPAAILEGTLYKLVRMTLDRGLRVAVARSQGNWVGKTGEGE